MAKMLGPDEIRIIRTCLANFDAEGISLYVRSVNAIIRAFDDQDVVQSLYNTGKFGTDTKEKLQNFVKIINEFRATYLGTDGLVEETKAYVAAVEEDNNKGMR